MTYYIWLYAGVVALLVVLLLVMVRYRKPPAQDKPGVDRDAHDQPAGDAAAIKSGEPAHPAAIPLRSAERRRIGPTNQPVPMSRPHHRIRPSGR